MAFDLSSLQNIDFTNSENLVFLAIIFVLAAIFVSLLAVFLAGVAKIIKKFTARLFGIDVKRPEFDRKDNTDLARNRTPEIPAGEYFTRGFTAPEKGIATPAPNPSLKQSPAGTSSYGFDLGLGAGGQPEKKPASAIINKAAKPEGTPMFGGKSEVSRRTLEQELRYDPKIWEASRQAGLTLSREERAKLVKETFSTAYGRNISKSDLRSGIQKLNQKMLGTKDPGEHAKIRKEIKFFKKIGGING